MKSKQKVDNNVDSNGTLQTQCTVQVNYMSKMKSNRRRSKLQEEEKNFKRKLFICHYETMLTDEEIKIYVQTHLLNLVHHVNACCHQRLQGVIQAECTGCSTSQGPVFKRKFCLQWRLCFLDLTRSLFMMNTRQPNVLTISRYVVHGNIYGIVQYITPGPCEKCSNIECR